MSRVTEHLCICLGFYVISFCLLKMPRGGITGLIANVSLTLQETARLLPRESVPFCTPHEQHMMILNGLVCCISKYPQLPWESVSAESISG